MENDADRNQSVLERACLGVKEAATATTQRCQSNNASINGDAVYVFQLRRDAKRLAESTKTLVDAAERVMVDRITELGKPFENPIPALLEHFDTEIMAIARTVLDSDSDDADADFHMRRIAEKVLQRGQDVLGKAPRRRTTSRPGVRTVSSLPYTGWRLVLGPRPRL